MFIINAIRSFARTNPLTVALGLQGIVLSVFGYSLLTSGPIDVTTSTGQVDITYVLGSLKIEAIAAILMLAIIALLGWGAQTRLTTRTDHHGIRWAIATLGLPVVLTFFIGAIIVIGGDDAGQNMILLKLFVFCITVGVFEETLYRGTLYHGLSRHLSPFWALMVSSALFGLFHMQNIMVGQDIAATMFQSFNAFALGIVFGAIMLQTNSIWWAIGLHTVWNAFLFFSAYVAQVQPQLVNLKPEDLAENQRDAAISLSAFGLPLFLAGLGMLIFFRWAKRMRAADAMA